MPNREIGEDPGRNTDRLLGELVAEVRALKHSENNTSTKVDAVGRQTAAIPELVSDMRELKEEQAKHHARLKVLEDDKTRREGAVGPLTWISRNWPVAFILTVLAAVVGWANDKLQLPQ